MRLKDAAGWNQTADDWRRLIELAPAGCFGIEVDGVLVATTSAVCYGTDLAWIGMVLTSAEHRGRGFARTLMRHALDYIESRGIGCVKLDATDMGRPLYEQLGFVTESLIERWWRAPASVDGATALPCGDIDRGLDRLAFGADRSRLLQQLAQIECACLEDGFAMLRSGSDATYFGPCVASSPNTAGELLASVLHAHGREPIYWDLLPDNTAALELAPLYGFSPRRRLARMAYGPGRDRFSCRNDLVYAIAGFEFG